MWAGGAGVTASGIRPRALQAIVSDVIIQEGPMWLGTSPRPLSTW